MKYTILRPPLSKKFILPAKDDLMKLKLGDIVKIMFQIESEPVERMWVRITKQQDIAEWTGVLDDNPYGESLKAALESEDEVIFHPLDIIQIYDCNIENKWKFKDSPDTGVYTTKEIAKGMDPVLYVFHDLDGDWQFFSSESDESKDGNLIHLNHLIKNDNTISELYDLPVGWHARRNSIKDPWERDELKDNM